MYSLKICHFNAISLSNYVRNNKIIDANYEFLKVSYRRGTFSVMLSSSVNLMFLSAN